MEKMVNFTSSLSPNNDGFVIFVSEKLEYSDEKNILSKNISQKIDSFIRALKTRKNNDEITSFDISNQQKCFIVKLNNKNENNYTEEKGADFFVYLKKNKSIKKIQFCIDTVDFSKEKKFKFFSEFLFGFSLKSYEFNKYKTQKNKILIVDD